MPRPFVTQPIEERRWRLWQIEPAIACNLECIMCPWKEIRRQAKPSGVMSQQVWEHLRPYLSQVRSIDFTGGGEPLLQPRLLEWLMDAKTAGCETGFLTNGVLLNKQIAEQMISAGVDWIAVSMDGATAAVYEKIRKGADFNKVCENLATLGALRVNKKPLIMLNFVIMSLNAPEFEGMVKLATRLGADQVNFKQCDVIRGQHGKGYGLFNTEKTKAIQQYKKAMTKAQRLAKKLKVKTTAYAFTPDEQPVCDQDPRDSLFVRYDGAAAPCINLAIGGQSSFLGQDVTLPTVHYGHILRQDLMNLWEIETCKFYRKRFQSRVQAYDATLVASSFEASWPKLQETLQAARDAMPAPPKGCNVCHYLYGV
jgi:MoaA/NifB/PqqE/SkfB family radical SAM enzyme